MTITRFCLIRHGETDWNAEKRYQGQLDIGLNAMGEAQARALAGALAGTVFSVAYASDLQRAWRTCELARVGDADLYLLMLDNQPTELYLSRRRGGAPCALLQGCRRAGSRAR